MPLKTTSCVAPRLEIPHQTCTFKGCFTRSSVGVSFSMTFPAESRNILVSTNRWLEPNCTEHSSVNMTSANVSWFCCSDKQNSSRLVLFCSLMNGCTLGLVDSNPSSLRCARILERLTSRPNSCLTSVCRSFEVTHLQTNPSNLYVSYISYLKVLINTHFFHVGVNVTSMWRHCFVLKHASLILHFDTLQN